VCETLEQLHDPRMNELFLRQIEEFVTQITKPDDRKFCTEIKSKMETGGCLNGDEAKWLSGLWRERKRRLELLPVRGRVLQLEFEAERIKNSMNRGGGWDL